MRFEIAAWLAEIAKRNFAQKAAVTPVTPVTGLSVTPKKRPELQRLQRLQVKKCRKGNEDSRPVNGAVTNLRDPAHAASDARAINLSPRPMVALTEDARVSVERLLDAMAAENERRCEWWREPVARCSDGWLTIRSAVTGENRVTKSRGKTFMVATIRAKGGVALSRSQLQCRLAVLIIIGETLIRVEQTFQVRAIDLLQSLPEPRDMSFGQGMSLGRAIIALTPIVIAAAAVEPRIRLLLDKIENSPGQKEEAMAPLQNIRQETFCQLVGAGNSATAAYAGAYGRARDATSRVNGRRLLTDANIWERIVEIRSGEASASLPTLRQIVEGAGQSAVQQIQTGSFRRACQAAQRFAHMIIKLSA